MSKNQRADEGRLEAEHGELDYRDPSDDEEVRFLPHRKGVDESDLPGADIRDAPEASEKNETNGYSRRSTRPKWNMGGGGPPVIPDWTGVLDLEATGGVVDRNVEHHGSLTPILPLERQFLLSHRRPRNGGPRQISDLLPRWSRSPAPSSSSVESSRSKFRPSLNLCPLSTTLSILLLFSVRTPTRSVSF